MYLNVEVYDYIKDTEVDGRPYCVVCVMDCYYIMPIKFKFEGRVPYVDEDSLIEITKKQADSLASISSLEKYKSMEGLLEE